MGSRYSFTGDGLHNIEVYGVRPGEMWEVLHAARRLTRQLGDDVNAVFGVTARGRYLMVLVTESSHEDNDWDIVAAREMFADEAATFNQYAGGQS